jgi:phytoene/squalene synthetase
MNYDLKQNFDLDTVIRFAGDYAKAKSPKASAILDFILKKPARDHLNLCFTYLRWVDDIVDNPGLSVTKKKEFIERQQNIFSCVTGSKVLMPVAIEEACLIHFVPYALSLNKRILADEVKNMVEALGMDVCRLENRGIFSRSDLDKYINLMSKSLFNIIYNFLYPGKPDIQIFLGKFTANAQMIRDLNEDIKAGFINISREEIDQYKLDLQNLSGNNFSEWLNEKIKSVRGILYEEVSLLKNLPLKFRIFTYYSLIYYLTWIIRAEVYNYELSFASQKTFFREAETYFISFFISIDIFVKGFILSPLINKK